MLCRAAPNGGRVRKFQETHGPYLLRLANDKTHQNSWLLRSSDEVVAEINYAEDWGFTGECAEGKWTFEKNKWIIQDAESGSDVGTFDGKWLHLLDGRRFRWHYFFENRRSFKDQYGSILIRFNRNFLATKVHVKIEQSALSVPGLPLLVVLGGCLVISDTEGFEDEDPYGYD